MTHLLRTTAVALAMGGTAFAAHAQDTGSANRMADAGSYCDAAWTKVDADGDGMVNRQEAQDAIEARFGAIDKDGDGNITRVEYFDCTGTPGALPSAAADRSAENFAEADANQDEAISRDEFRELAEISYDNVREAMVTEAGREEPFSALRRYVWMSPDEAENPQTMESMSKDEAAQRSAMTFDTLDTNDDGMVDTEEWTARPSAERDETWADARFDALDADASDSVSEQEYGEAMSRPLDQTTTASVDEGGTAQDDAQAGQDAQGAEAGDAGVVAVPVYTFHFLTY